MRRIVSPMSLVVLVLGCELVVSAAHAQPARGGSVVLAQSSTQANAKPHFDAAKEHYSSGRYREAIEELQLALEKDPDGADLVYNLGIIHEKLQEVDEAILYFQRYIGMIDDQEEKARVSKFIVRLESARDELAASREEEAQDEEGEAGVSKGRLDGWVIGAGVVAGLGLAGGTYFGLQALGSKNEDPPTTGGGTTYSDLEDNANRTKQMARYADIGFGVALVAGTTAMILYFARDAETEQGTAKGWEPGVAVLPGGAAASLRLGF